MSFIRLCSLSKNGMNTSLWHVLWYPNTAITAKFSPIDRHTVIYIYSGSTCLKPIHTFLNNLRKITTKLPQVYVPSLVPFRLQSDFILQPTKYANGENVNYRGNKIKSLFFIPQSQLLKHRIQATDL